MVLHLVGLGLGNEDDITVRGLKVVQNADVVVLEAYTSLFVNVDVAVLERAYQKSIVVADRDMVEQQADELLLEPAVTKSVAFLVVGDPVCATTHSDLILRARQRNIEVEIVHNASIMGAVGSSGLQLYNFGQTVSIPFFAEAWRPTSFYDKIMYNRRGGMHTLCLLDIQVKEPNYEAMVRGKVEYMPPRFMTVAVAARQLLEVESTLQQLAYTPQTLCVGLARMGQSTQAIVAGTLEELSKDDEDAEGGALGGPLHSLVICGEMHDMELESLQPYLIEGSEYDLSLPPPPPTPPSTTASEQPLNEATSRTDS
jgi:diphthine methyl ester synthase